MTTHTLRRELTQIELEILQLASDGLIAKEIAAKRERSEQTVRVQLDGIRRILDAATTTHAVAIALRTNLIK